MALGEYGGVALRTFSAAGGRLPPGSEISAELALTWPVQNRRALEESKVIRWHSQAVSQQRNQTVSAHVVHRGGGRFDVIEGIVINDEPLTKEQADALAGVPAERIAS